METKVKQSKVIAILNFKGGVGKTTTALNLGAALAIKGKRVLLIDLDVQMNSSFVLGYSVADGDSVYELMKAETNSYPIYDTETQGLQFIPASSKLSLLSNEIADKISRETILKRQIKPLLPHYDYIIIDCPPGKGVLTDNAMCAATGLIIPITCEMMTMQGVATILAKFEEIKQLANEDLVLEGFLLTKYSGQYKVGKAVRNFIESQNLPLFNTSIRTNMALNVYCNGYQSVFDFDKSSNGAKDYSSLADELLTHK